jgi:hypothetical protein
MRTLTEHEKKTVRWAGLFIGVYLALFGGFKVWQFFSRQHGDYAKLLAEAGNLRNQIAPYKAKAEDVRMLMEQYHLDPAKLSRASIVGEASAAIQKAAQSSGIQVGPVRESSTRSSSRELATVQFEGTGPVAAITALLNRMETLGYPLIIDTVQIAPDTRGPGRVKLNLTIVILDYDQWKQEVPRA